MLCPYTFQIEPLQWWEPISQALSLFFSFFWGGGIGKKDTTSLFYFLIPSKMPLTTLRYLQAMTNTDVSTLNIQEKPIIFFSTDYSFLLTLKIQSLKKNRTKNNWLIFKNKNPRTGKLVSMKRLVKKLMRKWIYIHAPIHWIFLGEMGYKS